MRAGATCCAFILAVLTLAPAAVRADECTTQAVTIEHERGLPAGLLHAISMAESSYHGRPQPYALRISGHSSYPASLALAAKRLLNAVREGRNNINAGCMQLSVQHHGGAFEPLQKILEPAANVRHAAVLLVAMRRDYGSWRVALARYQGGSGAQQQLYVCRVWRYLRILAPATASRIDASRCPPGRRPSISPAVIRQASGLRRRLSGIK